MSVAQQEQELRQQLEALETALGTPVISGELGDWVRAVRKAYEAAKRSLGEQLRLGHRRHFANILQQDLEMARQVEQLKEEDQAILEQMEEFGREIERLASLAEAVGRHESRAQQFADEIVDKGLMLVARVRKQETALTTWLMEAYQRDRGTVD